MPLTFTNDQILGYFIYAGIALGVLLVLSALRGLLSRSETRTEARSRRMRMIAEGADVAERLAVLKPTPSGGTLTRIAVAGNVPAMLRRSGLRISPAGFVAICVALSAVLLVGLSLFVAPPIAVGAGLLLGFGVPLIALRLRVRKQTEALVAQLPDALDLMARGLRVGHPLNTSIGAAAEEMADPIGSELGIIFDQVNYGENLPDAFQDFADRVDIEDVHYLAASVAIQHGSGGDLARVLDVLSKTIRGRISLRRKIRAISSEGRASATFLSILPFAMFGFTSFNSPNYYGGVSDDPLFMPLAVTVLVLVLANIVILRKLVNFHV